MSKKHDREQKVLQRLSEENRQLKQEVKSLRNSIRKLNKGYQKLEESDKIQEKDIPSEAKICWDCGTGILEKTTILNRSWRCCNNCGKKTKVKILG